MSNVGNKKGIQLKNTIVIIISTYLTAQRSASLYLKVQIIIHLFNKGEK